MTLSNLLLVVGLVSVSVAAQDAAPADAFFDSAGVKIRYIDQGQGSPVVFIHGYTGTLDRHFVGNGVFGALVKDYRAIALDVRGHGKSGKPHDPQAYGAEMGRDVIRLLDHLKIARAHIVGFSMGAIIAGHLVTTNPDRFITATFVAHHPVHSWTPADDEESEASARDLEGDMPFRSLIVGVWPKDKPPPSQEEMRKMSQSLAAANDVKALAAYNRGRRALVVTPAALGAVRVPVLAIVGTADPTVDSVRNLPKVMPRARVVAVDGAEHGGERGILRRPEFIAALREFLSATRVTTGGVTHTATR